MQAAARTEPSFARRSSADGSKDNGPARARNRWWFFGLLAAIIALYVGFGIPSLDKPGLYMDAVDPDYLVARMVHPLAPTEFWMLPGNEVFGRFPVLAGPYSGSFVAYLLVPFYLLLGGTLTALRVAHLCIGLSILIAAFAFLRAATRSLAIAFAVVAVLAVDPAFVLLFRTQAYICIFPTVLAVLGFMAMYRQRRVMGYLAAGTLFGLAAYGYFIFFFLVPGLALFCATDTPRGDRRKLLVALLGGLMIGASPYALGYGLVIGTLGLPGAIEYVRTTLFLLKVDSSQSYLQRLASVTNWTWLMLTGAWNAITFWGTTTAHRGQEIKAALLILIPLAAVPLAFTTRSEARMFRLVGYSTLSYFMVATIFGQRLGGHDLTPLLPLSYILTGLACALIVTSLPLRRVSRGIVAAAVVVGFILFVGNIRLTDAMTTQLGIQSGVGLFSSILSDYPKIAEANNDHTPHIFWQWGSLFQFIYLTDGKIPAYSSGGLKTALCQFGSAKVVLTGAETVHHPDLDFAKLGANVRATQLLHDIYSGFPYEIVTVTPAAHLCSAPVALAASTASTTSAPSASGGAASAQTPPQNSDAASTTLQLPDGIAAADAAPYTGIYPSLPGRCCFLADRASFSVPLPANTRALRFQVYAPNFPRVAPQRLTFLIDGKSVSRSPVLVKGNLTPIDVAIPKTSVGARVVTVTVVPSTAFVPKDLDISADTRTVSVVLIRVEAIGAANLPAGLQLPDGVISAAPNQPIGIYPGPAGECCFLADSAKLAVRVASAAHTLRFVIYVPDSPGAGQQQLTFSVGGRVVRRSALLRKGTLTAIEVPIPPTVKDRSAVPVTIAARVSFIPQQRDESTDTGRVSVVLTGVTSF